MPKYCLVIAYDGTRYAGWQVQARATSIQQVLEDRLTTILRSPISVTGSGRTDAGVHARGQVAHFKVDRDLDLPRVAYSLNCLLPADIRILGLTRVPEEFHARYSARAKCYRYLLCTAPVHDLFLRLYQWHYPYPLDISAMRKASKLLLGTHDFTSFANSPTEGSVSRNPIRTLTRLELLQTPDTLCIEVEGQSFLYKMVRNIVGTLVEVGRGKPHDLMAILSACDRRRAGQAAPPQGLSLEWVKYGT